MKITGKGTGFASGATLFVLTLLVFVPLLPSMPGDGLDPSWAYALNEAVARGLSFGQEVVFAFGPYVSVYSGMYHPEVYTLTVVASLCLSVFVWLALMKISPERWSGRALLCYLLLGMSLSLDALLFAVPVLAAICLIEKPAVDTLPSQLRLYSNILIITVFAALGLLPLIKSSLLLICSATLCLCSAYLLATRRAGMALACILACLISMVLFWLVSGQSIDHLLDYLASMQSIVSGYSSAMSLEGSLWAVGFYVMISTILLLVVALSGRRSLVERGYLFLLFSMYLLIAFKAGFVRHDIGHTLNSYSALFISAAILLLLAGVGAPLSKPLARLAVICAIPVIAVFLWEQFKSSLSPELFEQQLEQAGITKHTLQDLDELAKVSYVYDRVGVQGGLEIIQNSMYPGLLNAITKTNQQRWTSSLQAVNAKCQLDFDIKGSADIYYFQQACLLARGYKWDPRPVLQSYSAYTPELLRRNEAHLRNAHSPQNLLVRVQTIDGRLPSLDDGIGLAAMLDNYDARSVDKDWLWLEKKSVLHAGSEFKTIATGRHHLGEQIEVSLGRRHVFAFIKFELETIGKLVNLFYKPPQISLTLLLEEGSPVSYRIIPAMTETGFLLSPLVTDTPGLGVLFVGPGYSSAAARVIAVRIEADDDSMFWNEMFTLELREYLAPDMGPGLEF